MNPKSLLLWGGALIALCLILGPLGPLLWFAARRVRRWIKMAKTVTTTIPGPGKPKKLAGGSQKNRPLGGHGQFASRRNAH